MTDHELILNRIYQLIRERNLTVNRLATLSGVRQSTLTSLESRPTGVPKADTIRLLCKALGISVKDFFDFPPYNEVEK
ncbi:MAG: helix-turn-helix domain-containing protein [Lentilactobacillus diolivorans]|jgi:transcriptional regulator with XRE-family HTH domain|uniref:helix-turn-helix domain-containing protein n=1 Tax=Lentilactobacillus TaxID=2767893 RepID=UPI001C2B9CA6|nr:MULTISPECIES: helix-turn-helix transcriptional regulator [Lentilactobacillus]MBV0929674.1 helix-turn-helix domain-containing protein [Lentilactobacillus dabitei]MCH4164985.1 helix-turn-helix domain-containing protein [Lentilactobacillus diolivorans]MDM7517273.1 helix-turn-helix transcriptional regulator [Lentilactobacillus sp. TOM.63]